MYTISKEFEFCASHNLNYLPIEHPCRRIHGHNYKVTLEFQSEVLDDAGMVIDYRALKPIGEWIDKTFDHQHLNDVLGSINPTAENIAAFIHNEITINYDVRGILKAVTVKETDKTAARYEA